MTTQELDAIEARVKTCLSGNYDIECLIAALRQAWQERDEHRVEKFIALANFASVREENEAVRQERDEALLKVKQLQNTLDMIASQEEMKALVAGCLDVMQGRTKPISEVRDGASWTVTIPADWVKR